MAMWGSSMVDCLRISTIILGLSNLAVVIVGGVLLFPVFPGCDVDRITISVVMVSLAAAFKIFAMFNSGIAQKATAITILDSSPDISVADSINLLRRRECPLTYRVIIHILVAEFMSHDGTSSKYLIGTTSNGNKWKTKLLTPFVTTVCSVPLMHCFVGPCDLLGSKKVDHSYSLWNELDRTNNGGDTDDDNFENPFNDKAAVMNSLDDPVSQFLETVPRSENGSAGNQAEMFLPGLVIHMVPQRRHISMPLWKGWSVQESVQNYDAYLANREIFKDIVVSPNMFFDHLPWRCHNAMRKVLESQNDNGPA
ncbi:LIPASE CLASS 3 FAMILY PROTEIN [Salix purpurea]|uniref:LIPASE CLASS 3 FAMILY PROTEIN n=1 Tax=Salix purpurea TaxID=77065 RepID=A0A9Q0SRQ6_SALPP|nr:LIPASE CLASS 3 FAMILY PROTEIN [Salix purpurea]